MKQGFISAFLTGSTNHFSFQFQHAPQTQTFFSAEGWLALLAQRHEPLGLCLMHQFITSKCKNWFEYQNHFLTLSSVTQYRQH